MYTWNIWSILYCFIFLIIFFFKKIIPIRSKILSKDGISIYLRNNLNLHISYILMIILIILFFFLYFNNFYNGFINVSLFFHYSAFWLDANKIYFFMFALFSLTMLIFYYSLIRFNFLIIKLQSFIYIIIIVMLSIYFYYFWYTNNYNEQYYIYYAMQIIKTDIWNIFLVIHPYLIFKVYIQSICYLLFYKYMFNSKYIIGSKKIFIIKQFSYIIIAILIGMIWSSNQFGWNGYWAFDSII